MTSPLADASYAVVDPDQAKDEYAGSDVPGEFRRLTSALGCRQLALTLIRVPPHSDFEQGTGHYHDEVEELYLVTRGTLTMRFGDDLRSVRAPAAVRVDAATPRSHRNEGDEPVEMWAISRRVEPQEATKLDEFWEASPEARQHRTWSEAQDRADALEPAEVRVPANDEHLGILSERAARARVWPRSASSRRGSQPSAPG